MNGHIDITIITAQNVYSISFTDSLVIVYLVDWFAPGSLLTLSVAKFWSGSAHCWLVFVFRAEHHWCGLELLNSFDSKVWQHPTVPAVTYAFTYLRLALTAYGQITAAVTISNYWLLFFWHFSGRGCISMFSPDLQAETWQWDVRHSLCGLLLTDQLLAQTPALCCCTSHLSQSLHIIVSLPFHLHLFVPLSALPSSFSTYLCLSFSLFLSLPFSFSLSRFHSFAYFHYHISFSL